MTAKIRRLFALWAICLDRPVPKLVLCGFRLTDVAECNTEPTSPSLIGFRQRGSTKLPVVSIPLLDSQ